MTDDPITANWLASVGFKWHQLDRQPDKHWLLWLGSALRSGAHLEYVESAHDLGIELTPSVYAGQWHCWLRADTSHRYSRFLHVRHLQTQQELVQLIEGLTGEAWDATCVFYGALHTPEQASHLSQMDTRLDRQLATQPPHWRTCEEDPTQGGALPEHLEHFMTGRAE